MPRRRVIAGIAAAALAAPAGVHAGPGKPVRFRVRIENVSTAGAGPGAPALLSPGVWAIHNELEPLFTPGRREPGRGLESLAEDGEPKALLRSLRTQDGVLSTGIFEVPEVGSAPGPIGPGGAYEFDVTARPGTRLSFATAFLQANDLFLAPGETGIPLFDGEGRPIHGDVTGRVHLWDAGTEAHQEPGTGPAQGARQRRRNTGADEGGVVCLAGDGFRYPAVPAMVKVTVTARR
jgi:hypothetical protein